jgi:adenylylsulfate kinase
MNGAVVWFTGLPSSGKSALCEEVARRLRAAGRPVVILDGDDIREVLVPAPGHSPAERDGFYETLARLAALIARQGLVVLVAATAHRRMYRERARALAPRFVEVFLDVDIAECARRDAKGLYAASREGRIRELPGLGVAYERPEAPDVLARGGFDQGAAREILDRLGGAP